MSRDFVLRTFSVDQRRLMHVEHSLRSVAELPRARAEAEDPLHQIALLESWLIHVRLLAGFFQVRRCDARDFSAKDFGDRRWTLTATDAPNSVQDLWTVASQHLVHFSRERAPEDPYLFEKKPEKLDLEDQVMVARTILELAQRFLSHLPGDDEDYTFFRVGVAEAIRALDSDIR